MLTCDEQRGVSIMVAFSVAQKKADWQTWVENRLREELIRDGCPPETIEVDGPFRAEDGNGRLMGWEMQAVGTRPTC